MIKEQELKDKCTPEFIKWMCEYAKGFEFIQCEDNYFSISVNNQEYGNIITDEIIFPLLIHRAVEGWNKQEYKRLVINKYQICLNLWPFIKTEKAYNFRIYQPESLTHAECAMLHCLLDIFKEQEERDERV